MLIGDLGRSPHVGRARVSGRRGRRCDAQRLHRRTSSRHRRNPSPGGSSVGSRHGRIRGRRPAPGPGDRDARRRRPAGAAPRDRLRGSAPPPARHRPQPRGLGRAARPPLRRPRAAQPRPARVRLVGSRRGSHHAGVARGRAARLPRRGGRRRSRDGGRQLARRRARDDPRDPAPGSGARPRARRQRGLRPAGDGGPPDARLRPARDAADAPDARQLAALDPHDLPRPRAHDRRARAARAGALGRADPCGDEARPSRATSARCAA